MPQSAKRRKKRNRFRTMVVLFFIILVLALALTGAVMYLRRQDAPVSDTPTGRFSLQSITVVGNTHYAEEAIVGESGLRVGQNIFSVNKAAARKKIENTFPYVASVTVKSPSFNTIEIAIEETDILGAMYGDGKWLIVGKNGKILETMEVESDRPGRYFYLQGASPNGECTLGAQAMDERSLRIVNTVLESAEQNALDGLFGIDMRDKTNIALNYKNQLTVLLGSETNLAAEIQLLAKTLPQIDERNGGVLSGRLDLSSYSDTSDSNDKIVYTPQDVLENS